MSEEDNDPLGKSLGIAPYVPNNMVENMLSKAHDDSAKSDFEDARASIKSVIDYGLNSLSQLIDVAEQSQHPRAYEVVARMMDSIVTANKELMNLQSKIREIGSADSIINGTGAAKTINNNLFVGSTAELQKMIESMKNNE